MSSFPLEVPEMVSSDEELKSCCARAYSADVVSLVLGESYHPGGLDLTRRLAGRMALRKDQRVLDVASGPGTTAFLLAKEFGCQVVGVDLGEPTVEKANARAVEAGVAHQVSFVFGDAERLPVDDESFDAVISECAFCTFPDKPSAAAEMARVLKPGGRVGITDVALDPAQLSKELRSLAGWVACLADARPVDQYVDLLAGAGLRLVHQESHDKALARMIEQIDARLLAFSMTKVAGLDGIDLGKARERTAMAAEAVKAGIAGYTLLVAEKPY